MDVSPVIGAVAWFPDSSYAQGVNMLNDET